MTSILFLTKYSRRGASSRYRTLQYIPLFEQSGIHCTVSPLFDDAYLEFLYQYGKVSKKAVIRALLRRVWALLKCRKFDSILIEGEIFPYAPAFATKILSWMNVSYIVDYDDALFHQYDEHHSPAVRKFLGDKISQVMRGAALVVAGNDYLAEYATRAGSRNIQVIPTVVDLESYPGESRHSESEDIFTIGWIGSPSTALYLEAIAPALAEVCANGRARVKLIGSGACVLSGVPLEVIPWSEMFEIENISQFDVGIMPLPDKPWARGKCGLKLIQYMACSLPVVASPVGVNTQLVEDHHNGFLAVDNKAWVKALTTLRDNPDLRATMGKAGREKIERQYSLQVTAPRLAKYLLGFARKSMTKKKKDL